MENVTYEISGADSSHFLQGLLTCDINKLDGSPLAAACCNQKGRVIANFWIWQEDTSFYLMLPESMGSTLQTHLQKYVFRSQVSIQPSNRTTISTPPPTPTAQPIWILPETTEQFTPQMIDLEKQGGVSFSKGCYLGQEIIARTKHLGQLKRHLYQITLESEITPQIGTPINNSAGEKMGTIVSIDNGDIFAVIEDRSINEALTVNGIRLKTITQPIDNNTAD